MPLRAITLHATARNAAQIGVIRGELIRSSFTGSGVVVERVRTGARGRRFSLVRFSNELELLPVFLALL